MRVNSRRSRAALVWGLLGLAGLDGVLLGTVRFVRPEFADREYAHRQTRLHALLEERPGDPLLLLLGSSRMSAGVSPADLPPLASPCDEHARVFNFGMSGA